MLRETTKKKKKKNEPGEYEELRYSRLDSLSDQKKLSNV